MADRIHIVDDHGLELPPGESGTVCFDGLRRLAGPRLAAEPIAYCRSRLAPIKCPRSVDFEAALPRHENGKVLKRKLCDRYWEGRQNQLV